MPLTHLRLSLFLNLGVVYMEDARGHETCQKEGFKSVPGLGELMAFQEYSTEYTHELNTLGISGRPAGFGIYVSVVVSWQFLA